MAFRCSRCGQEGPQLEEKPLGGTLGEEIVEHVCQDCWQEWDDLQLKIINEYRLNLAIPQHYDMLVAEMRNFFGLAEGATGEANVEIDDSSAQRY